MQLQPIHVHIVLLVLLLVRLQLQIVSHVQLVIWWLLSVVLEPVVFRVNMQLQAICDSSCYTCSGLSNTTCTSCFNSFLLYGVCLEKCPYVYYEDYNKNTCAKITTTIIYPVLFNVNNPYKFLLVFYAYKSFKISFAIVKAQMKIWLKAILTFFQLLCFFFQKSFKIY